jgi:hypothetical protein
MMVGLILFSFFWEGVSINYDALDFFLNKLVFLE